MSRKKLSFYISRRFSATAEILFGVTTKHPVATWKWVNNHTTRGNCKYSLWIGEKAWCCGSLVACVSKTSFLPCRKLTITVTYTNSSFGVGSCCRAFAVVASPWIDRTLLVFLLLTLESRLQTGGVRQHGSFYPRLPTRPCFGGCRYGNKRWRDLSMTVRDVLGRVDSSGCLYFVRGTSRYFRRSSSPCYVLIVSLTGVLVNRNPVSRRRWNFGPLISPSISERRGL